jgi:hypothetical protein
MPYCGRTNEYETTMNSQQQDMYGNSFPPLPPAACPNSFSQMIQNTKHTIQPHYMSYNGTVSHQPTHEVVTQPPVQHTQYQLLPKTSTYPPQQGHQPQQIMRMSSTSEDEPDANTIPWQQATSTKRKKISRKKTVQADNKITTNNRYSILTVEGNNRRDTDTTVKINKPPPIYIYGVTNYPEMIVQLRNCLEDEQYTTKSLANNTIKINSNTAKNYQKLIRYLKEQNIIHHSY